MLGLRGNYGDDVSEMSGLPMSSIYNFFHQFVDKFSTYYFNTFVYFPKGDELAAIIAIYAKIGLPGTIGSIDCTHLEWARCPKQLNHSCKGKEQSPTLAFQVVCSHTRLILHCSNFFYGTIHDTTVAKNDWFTKWIIEGGVDHISYVLYDEHGRPRRCKGGHFLVDGGYEKLACFVNPQRFRSQSESIYWSECVESTRKDVECVFGILKKRFRILANALEFSNPNQIGNIMKICCIAVDSISGQQSLIYTS